MKIIAKFKEIKELKSKKELIFEVDSYPYTQMIEDLKSQDYSIEINEIKSKRSLQQNKYMWALIRDIAEVTQGGDEYDLYCQFLEIANVKYEYILVNQSVDAAALKKAFRAVVFMGYVEADGETYLQYKAFLGSSRFNSKEMNNLIDVILKTAYDVGIESYDYYFDMLKG